MVVCVMDVVDRVDVDVVVTVVVVDVGAQMWHVVSHLPLCEHSSQNKVSQSSTKSLHTFKPKASGSV